MNSRRLAAGRALRGAVLVDEVYLDSVPGGPHRAAATRGPVFITTSSLTKSYGLPGLRCGWVLAAPGVAERVRRARDVVDGSGVFPAERLSVVAFQHLEALGARARSILDPNRAVFERFGREDERYVFNSAGQVIDLKGLICVCRGDSSGEPLGTPVKDSMRGKIGGETRAVVGVIYAPRQAVGEAELMRLAAEFARLLAAHGGAAEHEIVLA